MLYGYLISQWLNVGIYMVGMTGLFTGILILSTLGTNYIHKEELKRNKLQKIKTNRNKNSDKKKYFIDVA